MNKPKKIPEKSPSQFDVVYFINNICKEVVERGKSKSLAYAIKAKLEKSTHKLGVLKVIPHGTHK